MPKNMKGFFEKMNSRECTFGGRLWKIRNLQQDTSQGKFAEKLGISKNTLNNYEAGKAVPSLSKAICYAERLDVSLDYLSGFEDTGNKLSYSTFEAQRVALAYDKADEEWKTIINKILDIR